MVQQTGQGNKSPAFLRMSWDGEITDIQKKKKLPVSRHVWWLQRGGDHKNTAIKLRMGAHAAVNAKAINSGDTEVNEFDSDIGTNSTQARR